MENRNSNHQLRYYINLGAPPRREKAKGNEPFLRPVLGFNPSWFHKYCGINFTEEYYKSPEIRLEAYEKMKKQVLTRFPGLNIGNILEQEAPDLLTGLYGAYPLEVMLGHEMRYFDNAWPACREALLSDEEFNSYKAPEPSSTPIMEEILKQMDRIEELTGTIEGFINYQGVLNIAFKLRGQTIFMDMFDNPEATDNLFTEIASFIVKVAKIIYARQEEAGMGRDFIDVGNCTVNMAGPEAYDRYLFPRDLQIRKEFPHFGVHNCAWEVDPYMDTYSKIESLGYLDMGFYSDLKRAKELFPKARRNVLYTSVDLANKTEEGLREDFRRIAEEIAPCDVGLPDIEIDVPDERIMFTAELCEELGNVYGSTKNVS